MYISKPLLVKIVHFQTYNANLLENTVNNVGSMHMCIGYMEELFSQRCLKKQVNTFIFDYVKLSTLIII